MINVILPRFIEFFFNVRQVLILPRYIVFLTSDGQVISHAGLAGGYGLNLGTFLYQKVYPFLFIFWTLGKMVFVEQINYGIVNNLFCFFFTGLVMLLGSEMLLGSVML